MSSINVNTIKSRLGGPPTLPSGVVVSAAATFSNDVSIGGTLTYEDVTNVDAVGLITARSGIKFGAAGVGGTVTSVGNATFAGIVTATSFSGDGSALTGIANTANVNTAGLNVVGVATVGTGLTLIDNIRAKFGTGGDLSLYHNGTDSYINNNTGNLNIYGDVVQLRSSGDEYYFKGTANAAAEIYYNNSKKIETTATGVSVAGTTISNGGDFITYDNGHFKAGLNADLDLFHNGTDSYIRSAVGDLNINAGNSAQNICINLNENVAGVTSEKAARFIKNGAAELYYDNSKKIETLSTGVKVTGITSTTSFSVGPGLLQEKSEVPASALTGTVNFDIVDDGMVHWHYTNASGTWVVNLRGDASTTFNSIMDIGKTTVFTLYSASNNASYYMTDFQIDGVSMTERWNGGSAPTAGTGSGTDVYTFNIFKTGDAAYTVYANFSNFA